MSSPIPDPGAVPDSPIFDPPSQPEPGEVPTAPDGPEDPPAPLDGPLNSA